MTGDIAELRSRAEAGDAEAQFRYGQALQYGLGVSMDDDLSLSWYQAAAAQGFDRARFSLGEIYKEGRIIPQDLVQAWAWHKVVAEGQGELQSAARESCRELAPYMTTEQMVEAEQKAEMLTA